METVTELIGEEISTYSEIEAILKTYNKEYEDSQVYINEFTVVQS